MVLSRRLAHVHARHRTHIAVAGSLARHPKISAYRRPRTNPRVVQRLWRVPSEVRSGARPGSNCPRPLCPRPSRPRPPGSDSITCLRSCLAFPRPSYRRSCHRSRPSTVPSHRGTRNARRHGSSPSGQRLVVSISCEHHRSSRGRAFASATFSRPCTVHSPS